MSKDRGWTMLERAKNYNFLKWGEYMKRAQRAEWKLGKLKALVLLTDDAVSDVEMNELTKRQWLAFIKCFPDEGAK
jgi:hypothetical protein